MVYFTSCLFFSFDSDSLRFSFKVPSVKSRCLRVCVGTRVCAAACTFGMSPCGQIGEDQQHATSVLIFISLMLKWDTVLCSACLDWWDNTWATPQTHASQSRGFVSPDPDLIWSRWTERKMMSSVLSSGCLFPIEIKLVILLATFITAWIFS